MSDQTSDSPFNQLASAAREGLAEKLHPRPRHSKKQASNGVRETVRAAPGTGVL
jgi:hypothetical protein